MCGVAEAVAALCTTHRTLDDSSRQLAADVWAVPTGMKCIGCFAAGDELTAMAFDIKAFVACIARQRMHVSMCDRMWQQHHVIGASSTPVHSTLT